MTPSPSLYLARSLLRWTRRVSVQLKHYCRGVDYTTRVTVWYMLYLTYLHARIGPTSLFPEPRIRFHLDGFSQDVTVQTTSQLG